MGDHASTAVGAISARSAVALESASTVVGALGARSVPRSKLRNEYRETTVVEASEPDEWAAFTPWPPFYASDPRPSPTAPKSLAPLLRRLRVASPRTREVPGIALLTLGRRVLPLAAAACPSPRRSHPPLDVLIPRVRGIEGRAWCDSETRETGIRGVHVRAGSAAVRRLVVLVVGFPTPSAALPRLALLREPPPCATCVPFLPSSPPSSSEGFLDDLLTPRMPAPEPAPLTSSSFIMSSSRSARSRAASGSSVSPRSLRFFCFLLSFSSLNRSSSSAAAEDFLLALDCPWESSSHQSRRPIRPPCRPSRCRPRRRRRRRTDRRSQNPSAPRRRPSPNPPPPSPPPAFLSAFFFSLFSLQAAPPAQTPTPPAAEILLAAHARAKLLETRVKRHLHVAVLLPRGFVPNLSPAADFFDPPQVARRTLRQPLRHRPPRSRPRRRSPRWRTS